MVRRNRHIDRSLHRRDDVEVAERRLDHDHVGTLRNVGAHLHQRLAGVAPVLLVGLAITPTDDGAIDGVAERPVEAAGVLRRVGENGRVAMAGAIESGSDRANLAIHHPAGSHHVGAGVGLRDRDAPVDLECCVVVHRGVRVSRRAVEHTAMPV